MSHMTENLSQTSQAKIFCPECGKQNSLVAKFCSGCGKKLPMKRADVTQPIPAKVEFKVQAPLASEVMEQPSEQVKSQKAIWVVVGVLAIVSIIVLVWKYHDALNTKIQSFISSEKSSSDIGNVPAVALPMDKTPENQPTISTHDEAETVNTQQKFATPAAAQQKSDTVKQPTQKADQSRSKRIRTPRLESQEKSQSTASKPTANQEIQLISIHDQPEENVHSTATQTEQKKKSRGLEPSEQTTDSASSEVRDIRVHECSDGEKAMHVNGC